MEAFRFGAVHCSREAARGISAFQLFGSNGCGDYSNHQEPDEGVYGAVPRTGYIHARVPHSDIQSAQRDIFQLSDVSWGSNTSTFLKNAVDGNLEWGHNQSIVCVNKYCVHRMHGQESHPEDLYDQQAFAEQFPELYHFLDMDTMTLEDVGQWIARFEEARQELQQASSVVV